MAAMVVPCLSVGGRVQVTPLADRGCVTSLRGATGLAGLQLLLAPPTGQVVIAVRLRRCPALYAHADERMRSSGLCR